MVKGYDPQKSDFVRSTWDKIISPFRDYTRLIPIPLATHWITTWYAHPSYTPLLQSFTPPSILLKRDCQYPQYSKRLTKLTPCSYIPEENIIAVCLSEMENKIELKEALDRELLFSYKMREGGGRDWGKDEDVMMALYEGCWESMGELKFPGELRKTLAKKCVKSNYYFRFFERDRYKLDQQYKYVHKMVDELVP